ncbi:MAG TPA: histidine kinase dimerization/phospho-acceptor domain-containing protein, partial [Dongiaceae bacterium]
MPKFLLHPLTVALAVLWVALLIIGIVGNDLGLACAIGVLATAMMALSLRWQSRKALGVKATLPGAASGPAPVHELARTLESVPAPLFALDGERVVVAANAAANLLFGGSIAGRNLLGFMRHPPFLEALEAVERGGQPEPVELPDSQGRGEPRTLIARLLAIRPPIAGGALMVLIEDATAAERALTLRRDFVANVSHEMKTPIAALLGFIETLMGPAKDDTAARQRFLGIMRGEAERMNRLVSELLSLSRIE